MNRREFFAGLLLASRLKAAFPPGEVERSLIEERAAELGERIAGLRDVVPSAFLPDVEICHKGLEWLLGDEEEFHRKIYSHDALRVAATGMERAAQLQRGERPWAAARGWTGRAYRSDVDASVQPYTVWVPREYDPARPGRLDVVLHGRNSRLTEVGFLADAERSIAEGPNYLRLDVFGRTNNAYRWAGETDVFEAIAAVARDFRFDADRVVLRGFSMGGAGAWHLGLHHPDRWAAAEAGAGFTDTLRYAAKSLPGGLKGDWQRRALRIYDAVDYAENGFLLPLVGYGGEDDGQLQASVNIREAMGRAGAAFRPEGLDWTTGSTRAIFLVGPKTGHQFHPESQRQSDAFIDRAVEVGRETPDTVRFVTYTTKYPKSFWVTVDGLEEHYRKAEVRAKRDEARTLVQATTENVSRLVLDQAERLRRVEIDGQTLEVAPGPRLFLGRRDGAWRTFADLDGLRGSGLVKRPGLQGPIDDAFASAFVCCGPEDDAEWVKFRREYRKFMQAEPLWRSDREMNESDFAGRHLVLFGTPETNRLLKQVADRLPKRWRPGLRLIAPNPLNPERYVVVGTGHTFGEKEFRGTNALLFPRLGDWAVVGADGEIEEAGMFDESWS